MARVNVVLQVPGFTLHFLEASIYLYFTSAVGDNFLASFKAEST